MRWPATLLGAAAGLALASIPGALLGGLLGYLLDRRLQLDSWPTFVRRLRGQVLPHGDELLFMLLGRVAKGDGRVLPEHIRLARGEMKRLGLDEAQQTLAIAAFGRGKHHERGWRLSLLPLRRDAVRAENWLRSCWAMARAGGAVSVASGERIRLWGRWMGLPAERVEQLAAEFEPVVKRSAPVRRHDDYAKALTLLGVSEASSAEQVKRAYRKLLSLNHPDKLAGQGASQAQLRAATERTRELHSAYAKVREQRGFR
ncbi:DnaJ like chaperone protein [Pseudomonas fluvialis]|uniref:DnaJ like chaperone protein n=1 Tax=Pseudomonas fluvialis TaxID=1793966 RepID=A0A7X0EVH2_9PSED|nr:DnaJ domain-containing protein [Pseudomonas fluvialis]MBB6342561.1 DnaJ like chaperone protein [Pseudomonas fluvialis]